MAVETVTALRLRTTTGLTFADLPRGVCMLSRRPRRYARLIRGRPWTRCVGVAGHALHALRSHNGAVQSASSWAHHMSNLPYASHARFEAFRHGRSV